jgi:hypothetical protein
MGNNGAASAATNGQVLRIDLIASYWKLSPESVDRC